MPIPGNNFTFKQRESGLKSLKKEGASIEKYNPFFFNRFSEQRPRLNVKLFPGIGIRLDLDLSEEGKKGPYISLLGKGSM